MADSEFFAVVGERGVEIRRAAPNEGSGVVVPFSRELLWKLERKGNVWSSLRARLLWMLRQERAKQKAAMDTDSSNGAPGAPVGASNGRT